MHAETFTVDAVTPYAADDGFCAIVEAIENANDDIATHADCPAGNGEDTIVLTDDIELDGSDIFSTNGPSGLPTITGKTIINGEGFSIRRLGTALSFRIFHIAATAEATINSLVIEGGLVDSGFDNGGGIFNEGLLSINESVIDNNQVSSIFPSGGGIYNNGNLILINSSISNNITADMVFSNGGGVYNSLDKNLTLINTTVENNVAGSGGGVWNLGPITVQNSVFRENIARETAGALMLFKPAGSPSYKIHNSTFANNSAVESGGAIVNGNTNTEIFGSFFTGNTVSEISGGALANLFGAIISITSSTFDGNKALSTALGGAISNVSLGNVNLIGSIISNNQCETKGGGLFTSLGNFYVSDSLISGNSADQGGGFYQGPSNIDGFFIERSSIVNNSATTFGGGGLAEGSQARSYILNSTVSGNTAEVIGGGLMLNTGGQIDLLHTAVVDNKCTLFSNSIGGFDAFAGTTNIGSSIFASNPNGDCSATSSSSSLDFNLTTSAGGGIPLSRWCSFIPIQPNDQLNTDPLLEPLALNGNVGPTYLLQAGSSAIDAIPSDCPASLGGVDQRGVVRPSGSCDIGPISSEAAVLPVVAFAFDDSVINNEATVVDPHLVDLVVDNTNGNISSPAIPLRLYISIKGTAALDTDYSTSLTVPTVFVVDAGNWPAPGDSKTFQLDFTVIDDLLLEGSETIQLSVSLTGPGILGDRKDHIVTIIDNEFVGLNCSGFLPPFNKPRTVKKSETTIPAKIKLYNYEGNLILPGDLAAPPEIVVNFDGVVFGDETDDDAIVPVGSSNIENVFRYEDDDEFWSYRLNTGQFLTPGVYTVTVRSGDPSSYSIENDEGDECVQTFTKQ